MALHRMTAAAATGVLVLGLAGCGGDPKPSASSATPTPTASVSRTGPVAPVLPPAASKRSAAGARAFLDFWFKTVTYAMRTGDVKAVERNAEPECRGCNNLIRMVGDIYSRDLRLTGGGWVPLEVGVDAGVSLPYRRFVVAVRQPPMQVVNKQGHVVKSDDRLQTLLYVSVRWRDGRWRTLESVKG